MILLIDGYNLLKNIHKIKRATEQQIDQFITQLHTYANVSGNELILVFDGGPDIYPSKEKRGKISIVYSGVRRSADDLVKDYLDQLKGKDTLLVSTDRALDAHAKKVGTEFIDSHEFYDLMMQRLTEKKVKNYVHKKSALVKISSQKNSELDVLMEEASQAMVYKSDDIEQKQQEIRHKVSKNERKKQKKINKI